MAGKDDWIDDVRRWCFDGGHAATLAAHDDLAASRPDASPAEIAVTHAATHAATMVAGPWPSPADAIAVRSGRNATASLERSAP